MAFVLPRDAFISSLTMHGPSPSPSSPSAAAVASPASMLPLSALLACSFGGELYGGGSDNNTACHKKIKLEDLCPSANSSAPFNPFAALMSSSSSDDEPLHDALLELSALNDDFALVDFLLQPSALHLFDSPRSSASSSLSSSASTSSLSSPSPCLDEGAVSPVIVGDCQFRWLKPEHEHQYQQHLLLEQQQQQQQQQQQHGHACLQASLPSSPVLAIAAVEASAAKKTLDLPASSPADTGTGSAPSTMNKKKYTVKRTVSQALSVLSADSSTDSSSDSSQAPSPLPVPEWCISAAAADFLTPEPPIAKSDWTCGGGNHVSRIEKTEDPTLAARRKKEREAKAASRQKQRGRVMVLEGWNDSLDAEHRRLLAEYYKLQSKLETLRALTAESG